MILYAAMLVIAAIALAGAWIFRDPDRR